MRAQPVSDTPETLLRREMQERRIPGMQVAVVQRGKIVLLKSFGTADLQSLTPVTDQTIFSINSCTKAITGVAIMQLVEEGKVDLAAPVSRYLDGLPDAWQPVTVRQLLTHVSGLPDILSISDPTAGRIVGNGSDEAAWAKLVTLPMDFKTGERFSYNQTNYVLLGMIIAKLRGKPFADVFAEQQFHVAGMRETFLGDSRDIIPHRAPSYRYTRNLDGHRLSEDRLVTTYEVFLPFRRTASGMYTTATDLAHWLIALQQRKLLKTPAALQTLWTAGIFNDGKPTQWALGWVTKPRAAHRAVIGTGGGRAAFFVYPEDDLTVVVLTNLAGAFPEDFVDELAGFYDPAIAAADPITRLRMELRKRGYAQALAVAAEFKKQDPSFEPTETDLNDWAYRLMSQGKKTEALEIFKLNVARYPASANVYDSVAEAYEANGNPELAIKNYERSLELDPKNTNAMKRLKQLRAARAP
jgi:CubicO group peptidase (beta-lactamase class C family)